MQEYFPGSHRWSSWVSFCIRQGYTRHMHRGYKPWCERGGDVEAWTPLVSVRVYIFLLWHMRFKVNFYNRVILIFKPYWLLYVCDLHSCLVDDRRGAETGWWCQALDYFIWPLDIYGTLCCVFIFFLFDIVAYMVAHLSFILHVSHVLGGQSAGDEPAHIDKGKVIRCFLFD